jgi:hypothetical protein
MMKRKRTRARAAPAASAIIVEDTKQVTMPLLRALREALTNSTIGFEQTNLAKDLVKFDLSGTPIRAFARESYSVFPLLQREAELFWMGAVLIFKRELGTYRLNSISLVVFKGDAIDERKTPLFRAEWDYLEDHGVDHAQPHWHVYPRILDGKEESGQDFSDFRAAEIEDVGLVDPQWATASNFHYAMGSRWDVEAGHQQSLADVEQISKWIKGCIEYCRTQLAWLLR